MRPITWRLREIWPKQGGLFRTIKLWRASKSGLLDHGFPGAKRKDVMSFPAGWKRATASVLYSMDWMFRRQVLALAETGKLPVWKTWLMLNCPPAGGRWEPLTRSNGHAGSPCFTPICPWCYLRRVDETVKEVRGIPIGPGSKFAATSYVLRLNRLPDSADIDACYAASKEFRFRVGTWYRISAYRYDGVPDDCSCAVSHTFLHAFPREIEPTNGIEIVSKVSSLRELVYMASFHSISFLTGDPEPTLRMMSVLNKRRLVGRSR
jgi:hypothetical protein